jgi:two-component system phosphate regulon sensor histidine kinase PhoR
MEPRLQVLDGKITLILNASKHTIIGDEVHLSNILYNLVDNAIKYCDKTPEITIITQNKHKGIEISIKDNGKGIDKHLQKMRNCP